MIGPGRVVVGAKQRAESNKVTPDRGSPTSPKLPSSGGTHPADLLRPNNRAPRPRWTILRGMIVVAVAACLLAFGRFVGLYQGLTLAESLGMGVTAFALFRDRRRLVLPGLIAGYCVALLAGFLLAEYYGQEPAIASALVLFFLIPTLGGCGMAYFVRSLPRPAARDVAFEVLVVTLAFGPLVLILGGGLLVVVQELFVPDGGQPLNRLRPRWFTR